MVKTCRRTLEFLIEASHYYKNICPEQARFLMGKFQSLSGEHLPEEAICPFCSQWRQPDDHRVRLRPKRKASRRVQRLLRRAVSKRHLDLQQTRVLRRFCGSRSTLMATCHTCSRVSRQPGVSRDFIADLSKTQSTPGSASRHRPANRTPQTLARVVSAAPKSSNDSTPFRTPRSISTESGSSSSSKHGGVTSAFARLRKLLMPSNSQKSKKGSLKDFLSSL